MEEFGACYSCLYVDAKVYEIKKTKPIPERRPVEKQLEAFGHEGKAQPEKPGVPEVEASETGRRLMCCKVYG